MIILHTGMTPSGLVLWGETPTAARRGRLPVRGTTRGRSPTVDRHPFDAGSAALRGVLGEFAEEHIETLEPARAAAAWLPTRGKAPIVTSLLRTSDAGRSRASARIAPWAVTVQPLHVGALVAIIERVASERVPSPGIVVGGELSFWARALELAAAIVARGAYVPTVDVSEGAACWRPWLVGETRHALDALVRAMPPSARALTGLDSTGPPRDQPAALMDRFLASSVDQLVRAAAGGREPARQRALATVHDSWSAALVAPDAGVDASDGAIEELAAAASVWTDPLADASTAPTQLACRLEEPTAGVKHWRLTYHLRATFDPSLLVPVSALLDSSSNESRAATQLLERHSFDVTRHLLRPLGQAATLCPDIAASLQDGQLDGADLSEERAYDFLTTGSLAIEQAGFSVMLPAWFTRRGRSRLALRAKARSGGASSQSPGGGLTIDSVARVEWSVALGDLRLTRRELETLAKAKVPLVRMRGEWVHVDQDELRTTLAHMRSGAASELSVRELVHMALGATRGVQSTSGALRSAAPHSAVDVQATGELGALLERFTGASSFAERAQPPSLQATLRPYQVRGFAWLAFLRETGFGACLADDMGLGKTIQTLASIAHERERAPDKGRPVLLVCPTSVLGNWQREAERFTPDLPLLLHHGPDRLDGETFTRAARHAGLVLTSYALLHRDHARLEKVQWGGVVLDEAQYIKNPETHQARAARALRAGWRVALTGTPVENHVGDLWSIMEFLNPGLLGTRAAFRREYLLPIQTDNDSEAAERLRTVTQPFVLRRLKSDRSIIRDLPRKNEMKVRCSLTAEQATLYKAVLEDAQERIESSEEGIERKGLVLALMTKLKQVCNHPAQLLADQSSIAGRSGKLERLTAMLAEALEGGERALVFTQFTEMGAMIRSHLEQTLGEEVGFLRGSTSRTGRDKMVETFQAGTGPRVLVLSLKAGGTGLNLTAASHVFHYDRWWNPAVENQATDRVYRIGQRRSVSVHKFVCLGTFEERIDELIERKASVAGAIVGSGEGWLTELSNEQLRSVFALDAAEAVVS